MLYRVYWDAEIEASGPLAAAQKAREILRNEQEQVFFVDHHDEVDPDEAMMAEVREGKVPAWYPARLAKAA
jgi:hypothetical protein